MIRETKKGEKERMGVKEREREREGVFFIHISYGYPGGPDVVGHNVGIGH